MNKDEIKELTNILENQCNNAPYDYCMGCNCNECRARTVIDAGYHKIADNQMVFTAKELCNEFSKHRRETARDIFQELKKEGIMYCHFVHNEHLAISLEKLKVIANKYGIEIE